ncbi:MAG: hypothetical protein B6244_02320 [Candidatus Cloacimonetes bacterium 4572_55]|nr:MAG: hypothetical protein B6244_02320 [Candidatus Cloacimonetes bacterium 4572_55]
MHRLLILLALISAIVLSFAPVMAQVSVTAVPFMTIEPGARGNGMGNAYAAIAEDSFGQFWNPGGLGFMDSKHHVALERSPWFEDVVGDMYLAYFGYNQPISDLGVFGVHFHYLNMGRNYKTGTDSPIVIDEFDSFDYSISLGYGVKVHSNLGLGINFKIIHSHLADEGAGSGEGNEGSGTAYGFDMGTLYKNMIFQGLSGAIVFQNLGGDLNYVDADQSDPLPRTLRISLAYQAWKDDLIGVILTGEAVKLLVELDEKFSEQLSEQTITGIGSEVTFMDIFSARIGHYRDKEGHVSGMTFGGGFRLLDYNDQYSGGLDFAFIPGGDLQDYNKKFSFFFSF